MTKFSFFVTFGGIALLLAIVWPMALAVGPLAVQGAAALTVVVVAAVVFVAVTMPRKQDVLKCRYV